MRKLLVLSAAVSALVFSACVHRPYYREIIGDAAGQKEVSFRILNAASGQPLPNVPIRVSGGNEKISVLSDANGEFKLPVKKTLLDPYTVVDVVRPPGVERYTLERLNGEPSSESMSPPTPKTPIMPVGDSQRETTAPPLEGQASDAGV